MLNRDNIKIGNSINYLSTCPHRAKLKIVTGTQASITLLNLNMHCKQCLLNRYFVERGKKFKCILSFCHYSQVPWEVKP